MMNQLRRLLVAVHVIPQAILARHRPTLDRYSAAKYHPSWLALEKHEDFQPYLYICVDRTNVILRTYGLL